MPLCVLCTELNLPTVFRDRKTSNFTPIHTLFLSSLRDSAKSCDLCTLFLSLVDFQSSLLQNADPSLLNCRIYLVDYGDMYSHKDRRVVDPVKGVHWEDRDVESVPRLQIDVDRQDRSIPVILPCGLQMKVRDGATGREEVLRGRIVRPELDIGLLKRWIGTCTGEHEAICKPGKMNEAAKGLIIRVIDIENMCIVDLPSGSEFVVLSYVWGATKQLRLLQTNLDEFTKQFGLSLHVGELPKTISDAMDLVGQLGQRYLWVDALCIIQDSPTDLGEQIQHMNDVYGCASLTIVAASGIDSNAGLPGLKMDSRKSLLIDEEIEGVQLVTALPIFARAVNASVSSFGTITAGHAFGFSMEGLLLDRRETRGWTMQEKVLSKRLVIFTEYQVFYHCNSATWCEDAIWEPEDPYFLLQPGLGTMSPHLVRAPLPHRNFTGMRKYAHLVTGYHTRQLTNQGDALNAFTGALTALGKELTTSFIWGIPKSSFDDNIIWQTPLHSPSLRREQFPSWSWLGWKASDLPGDLEFPVIRGQHLETIPVIQWHQITTEGKEELIGSPSTEYRKLPEFKELSTVLTVPPQHLLRFWALSAFLYVGRDSLEGPKFAFEGKPSSTSFSQYGCENFPVGIREPDGEIRQFARISLNEQWRKSQPDLLEFIMICRRRSKDLWNEQEIHEGVDLMLIETRNDISFRIQLTREYVMEGWWLYARPQWRVVTLG